MEETEEDSSYEVLEKEFQQVLSDLLGNKALDKFRQEYEKLTKALTKCRESEKRLMIKCRDLNADIVTNSVKVATALKLSEEDQTTITMLKEELEKAWRLVDAAHEKEQGAKDTIHTLKQEIDSLVKQGASLSLTQQHSVDDLLKAKEQLTTERDQLLSEVVVLREDLTRAEAAQQENEAVKKKDQETISQQQQEIQVRQNECSRESWRKEKLEKELRQVQGELEAKQAEISALSTQCQRSRSDQQRLEEQLRDQKILTERTNKEVEQLQQHNTKLQQDVEQATLNLEQLSFNINQQASELKVKEEEVSKLKQEITKLNKMREATQRRIRVVEDQKLEVEQQRDTLKNQTAGLEREMETAQKQAEKDKKKLDDLVKEKEALNKSMIKAASATEKQLDLVKLHEQTKKSLEQEILSYKAEAQKQRKIILQLEKERDKYINEASSLTQKVLAHMEEIKAQEMQIFEYKKKMAEAETKFTQQQNHFENVIADRNRCSQNLTETQHEITELKRKLQIMTHQLDQLKEEIGGKEAALIKEHREFQHAEQEKVALKAELQKMKQEAQEIKRVKNNQEVEERKLLKIIADTDAEKTLLKKELNQLISERDMLGTQLTRRNDELSLLYEKIKFQQAVLNKGEVHYNQRVEDIHLLRTEVKKLRREKGIVTKTVSRVEDLRREVNRMQTELLKEQTRCQALEELRMKPMNIHRWRRLEASDPSTFELLQKTQTLQRLLLKKTEEVMQKDHLLQEKEMLYVELKHVLARQPGPEAAKQINILQHTLKKKTRELQARTAEASAFQAKTMQYKCEIEYLTQEMQDVKKKYLAQKRKEQEHREKEGFLPTIAPQRHNGARFTGGGFNLKQVNVAS
ncbi:cilia- and flagella-associated protein 58 isoform X2 [Brachyhypopomus gauderio]|uniref:cilia- and flagella-associated protein 58 isoform X2 n=1 Tax=Brachyhypopomus gauderio TaxID=698409 RepID=UPI0040412D11